MTEAATLAQQLTDAGYTGLFLAGDRSAAGSLWCDGANRAALLEIVESDGYGDLARLLASEILYRDDPEYPPDGLQATLGPLYARALGITADTSGPLQLSGNEWGFLYRGEELGLGDDGELGTHLLETDGAAVPALVEQLDDARRIYYVGSQEATLGNSLEYRVKDAAAYFLGKLTGAPVAFHDDPAARDAEIDRLRAALDG